MENESCAPCGQQSLVCLTIHSVTFNCDHNGFSFSSESGMSVDLHLWVKLNGCFSFLTNLSLPK